MTEEVYTSTTTIPGSIVEVEVAKDTDITSLTPVAEVKVPEFVVTSAGLYTGELVGGIPAWLDQAITAGITQDTADLRTSVETLGTAFDLLETGTNQTVQALQTELTSTNALVTTVQSQLDDDIAGVITDLATKVTTTEAEALITSMVGSQWLVGNELSAEAYVLNQVGTYAASNLVSANEYSQFVASISNPDTGLTAIASNQSQSFATVGLNADGTLNAGAGEIGKLTASVGSQTVSIDSNDIITLNQAGTYEASMSKLITSPTGAIAGWTTNLVGDGTDTRSDITFTADVFKVQGSTVGYTPFKIDTTTGKISFTGDVSFEGLGINGDSTTINGGIIETNTVTADQINTTGLLAENIYGTTITSKNIEGGTINGAVITAAVLRASYLDLDGEIQVLTNYHITTAMYNANPSLYTDAIYIAASDEYRIPSLTAVRDTNQQQPGTTVGASLSSTIWAYDVANVGVNTKCVKSLPRVHVEAKALLVHSQPQIGYCSNLARIKYNVYQGDKLIFTVSHTHSSNCSGNYYSDMSVTNYYGANTSASANMNTVTSYFVSNGIEFSITSEVSAWGANGYLYLEQQVSTATADITNGSFLRIKTTEVYESSGNIGAQTLTKYTSDYLYIDNLV